MKNTVVIIDDSKFIVDKLSTFFTRHMDFEVLATGKSGVEAVDLYRKYRPDLITLDLSMPEKSGTEALREIIAEFPGASVLIISAIRGNVMLETLQIGAKDYIEKPMHLDNKEYVEEMVKSIRGIVAEKTA